MCGINHPPKLVHPPILEHPLFVLSLGRLVGCFTSLPSPRAFLTVPLGTVPTEQASGKVARPCQAKRYRKDCARLALLSLHLLGTSTWHCTVCSKGLPERARQSNEQATAGYQRADLLCIMGVYALISGLCLEMKCQCRTKRVLYIEGEQPRLRPPTPISFWQHGQQRGTVEL